MKITFRSLKKAETGFAQALGMVVATLISILIGVLIYFKLAASTSAVFGANIAANIYPRAMFNATNTSASTIFTLAPIIGIVMIAGIILAIVTRFGQAPTA